jgi:tetratricopeptide (TPR) repeat protein
MVIRARSSTVLFLAAIAVGVGTLAVSAQQASPGASDLLQAGDVLMAGSHYGDALRVYRRARETDDVGVRVRAGAGAVRSLLRLGLFREGAREGAEVAARDPSSAPAIAVHGDALWAFGLFPEAEARYTAALALDPEDPGGLHGRGRAEAARLQFDPALADVTRAISLDPLEPSYQYSLAMIYEQTRQFGKASEALAKYVELLPKRDDSDLVKWARTQSRYLSTFRNKVPLEIVSKNETYSMPFHIENGRVLVNGRVNGGPMIEFAVDTGADQAVLTTEVASRNHVQPFAALQSAGIGDLGIGYRSLQIARMDDLEIGSLHVRNVPCLIKDPPLKGLPGREGEGFSPLVFGLSMKIDYKRQILTMARELSAEPAEIRLPLWMQRLAVVQGTINNSSPAAFVVDTGGEGMSLSRSVASLLPVDPDVRRVPVRVYGTSGWDNSAYLLPFTNIDFARGATFSQASLVVLNLDAPSALLGFNIGGIVGHQFLGKYTVTIDLPRHEMRLQPGT